MQFIAKIFKTLSNKQGANNFHSVHLLFPFPSAPSPPLPFSLYLLNKLILATTKAVVGKEMRIFRFDKLTWISQLQHLERNSSTFSTGMKITIYILKSFLFWISRERGASNIIQAGNCNLVWNVKSVWTILQHSNTGNLGTLGPGKFGWTLGNWEMSLLSLRGISHLCFIFLCLPFSSHPWPAHHSCSRSHVAALGSSYRINLMGPAPITDHL